MSLLQGNKTKPGKSKGVTSNKKFHSFLHIFSKSYTISHVQVNVINICLLHYGSKGTGYVRFNSGWRSLQKFSLQQPGKQQKIKPDVCDAWIRGQWERYDELNYKAWRKIKRWKAAVGLSVRITTLLEWMPQSCNFNSQYWEYKWECFFWRNDKLFQK